jgi:hypothetical protein
MNFKCAVCVELMCRLPLGQATVDAVTLIDGNALCYEHILPYLQNKAVREKREATQYERILGAMKEGD